MPEETCWTLIRGASAGEESERAEFSRRYLPVIRAYLRARWGGRLSPEDLEDALQEVFVQCLREGGALERAAERPVESFRAFLHGVVRHVAESIGRTRARRLDDPRSEVFEAAEHALDEESSSREFDRRFSQALVREAVLRQVEAARASGAPAERRVELLRLRIQEDLPIREIARRWDVDRAWLHHEYARARKELREHLLRVVAFHHPGAPEEAQRECEALLLALE